MAYYDFIKLNLLKQKDFSMKRALGLLLGFTATALWGSFYIVGRWLFGEDGDQLNPYLFTLLRFGMAVVFFSPLLFFAEKRALVKRAFSKDFKMFFFIALVGIVMETFLVFYALNFTTSARCSLMANCSPIAIVIFSFLVLKQRTPLLGIAGMLAGFAGIVAVFAVQGGDIYANTGLLSLIGDGMALASGVCWACFTVFGVRLSREYGGLVSMFVCFIFGLLIMIPANLFLTNTADFAAFTPRIWCGMVYTGVLTLALANFFWYAALKYLKPVELGAFSYLTPVLTFVLSAIVLKERFSMAFIAAVVLILSGMFLMMVYPPVERRNGEKKAE